MYRVVWQAAGKKLSTFIIQYRSFMYMSHSIYESIYAEKLPNFNNC